ncbi:F-box family protein [Striga asiatica]|uniref:F-box family protein n=1 Tax=Striga asiatica TaxID=4170 RepID=A0A5A7R5T9_STRAF|nr:F-box family protein [Striga asiatica]
MKKSAEIIASNEDLLTRILLPLPIKSLFRFKCVSTQWLSLISSHYFSKNHTLRNPIPSSSGLILHHFPQLTLISLTENRHLGQSFGPLPVFDFLKIPTCFTYVTILSSCNGLLLCLLVAPPGNNVDLIYTVCNPATKKSNPLPRLENLAKKPIVNMDLAFNPQDSPNYKVICIRHCSPPLGPDFEIQVFFSETGSWKTCQGPFLSFRAGMLFQGGVYWNKRVHYFDSEDDDSLYFDVESETVNSLQMPPVQSEVVTTKRSWYMGESGGYLHLVDIETNVTRDSSIVIYELLDDGSGWVMLFRVGLSALQSTFPEMVQYIDACSVLEGIYDGFKVGRYYTCSVLGLVRKEDGRGLELILSVPNRIGCYDPATGAWRVAAYFGDDRDRWGYNWHNVVCHADTLSPV